MNRKGFFFPYLDENISDKIPIVVILLIAVNFIVFILEFAGEQKLVVPGLSIPKLILDYGFVPAQASILRAFTSTFLHADIFHIGFNMWFLWIFGDNIELKLGKVFFLSFFIVAGLFATFANYLSDTTSTVPTIGASGAISGVMGAYLIFFPNARIKALGLPPFWGVYYLRAYVMIGIWFLLQVLYGALFALTDVFSGTAYFAHVGGFLFGVVFAKVYLNFFGLKASRRKPI